MERTGGGLCAPLLSPASLRPVSQFLPRPTVSLQRFLLLLLIQNFSSFLDRFMIFFIQLGIPAWTVSTVWVKSFSRVWLFASPWTVAYKAPPTMGFSRQGYWSGLPLPSPHPYMTTSKTTALTIWTFVSKVMSLLFNMLSFSYLFFRGARVF